MKKVFLATFSLSLLTLANAQVKIGVQAGLQVTAPNIKDAVAKAGEKASSVVPGIVFEIPVFPGFNFRPSINYLQQVSNISELTTIGGTTIEDITKLKSNNFQIPLDFNIPLKAGKGKLLINLGPVVTIGTKAEATNITTNLTTNVSTPATTGAINFGSAAGEIKKVDWGARFGLGYRFNNGLDILAQYKAGLTDIDNQSSTSIKNNQYSITLSYFLFGNKK